MFNRIFSSKLGRNVLKNASFFMVLAVIAGSLFTSCSKPSSSPKSSWTWIDRSVSVNAQGNPISGNRSWQSIASSSDGEKLAAVVKGGGIYTSADSGATWIDRSAAARSRNWRSIASSSDGKKLAAVVENGGVYTSDDFGATWAHRTLAGNRNWRSIASSSDGSKLAAVVENGGVCTGVFQ